METNRNPLANLMLVVVVLAAVALVIFLIYGEGHEVSSPEHPVEMASAGKATGEAPSETPPPHAAEGEKSAKPAPDEVLQMLKAGNVRFYSGKATHPNADAARLDLAGSQNQGDYAYATVITCSDSRVPVEIIFDAGVMDIFVIRVAGNVCDTDEIGSIEYGLAHVNTPVLVVLGHTQCGAVTAVTRAVQGKGHKLERNIPPLVDNIVPAVKRAMKRHKGLRGDAIIPQAIQENVWQSVEDLFMQSPAVRNLVHSGAAKVVGAIYDVGTGKVNWLDPAPVERILKQVEASPDKQTEAYATE